MQHGFRPSQRAAVAPFYVMRVLAAAARRAEQGQPLFNLAAGQPSTPAPEPVLAAAHHALDSEILGYTETPGIAPLRRAIAGHYRRRYDLDVDPADVVVTTGSSGGFLLAFLAAFDVGARVGLARPGYPAYRNILHALGCDVVDLPCGPETRYQPTTRMIDGLGLDGLIVASPANPTGTMLSPAELAELDPALRRHRGAADLRRDLPRHHLLRCGHLQQLGNRPQRHRGEFVLQVLLDDRLADRLAAGAPRSGRRGGRAGRQPGDLPAGAGPVRRRWPPSTPTPSATAT